MSTYLAAELEALPENYIVAVEKNRWRRLWAIITVLLGAAAAGSSIFASTFANCEGRRRYCEDEEAAMFVWLMISSGWLFWALVMFGVWWACREYRPVIREGTRVAADE